MQIVDGCIQLTSDSEWTIEHVEQDGRTYARVINEDDEVFAVTSTCIRLNDWVLPTTRTFGFLLRQSFLGSRYFEVVGRAAVTPSMLRDQSRIAAFMMWFGAEDLLAHMSYALNFIFDWDDDGPSEGLHAALVLPFCGAVLARHSLRYHSKAGIGKKKMSR